MGSALAFNACVETINVVNLPVVVQKAGLIGITFSQ